MEPFGDNPTTSTDNWRFNSNNIEASIYKFISLSDRRQIQERQNIIDLFHKDAGYDKAKYLESKSACIKFYNRPKDCILLKFRWYKEEYSYLLLRKVVVKQDKNLSDELKRKNISIPTKQFQLFLKTLQAGSEDITYGNQQKLSYIHGLLKAFPPATR
jgi:hypothetical protein